MSDLLTDADLKPKPITKPPTRWKNRWMPSITCHMTCIYCGARRLQLPGKVFDDHCKVYPSKDLAESCAGEGTSVIYYAKYLGAFPIQES